MYMATKKLLAGVTVATLLMMQVPTTVFAATDQEILAATQAGVEYLADNQNDDGSIAGYGGETDWAVMAVEASDQAAANLENGSGVSAVAFMEADVPGPTTDTTDIERRMIAIVATGEDTTDFGGINYNELLAAQHVDGQIGDTTLLNDDMFGVMAVSAVKDPELLAAAQDALDYFIAHQGADGGFSYTTLDCEYCGSDSNDTAAAIIAMKAGTKLGLTNNNLETAQSNALIYLLSTQQADGGFAYNVFSPSDGSSTAWGLMALNVIGDSVKTQALAARNWLLANQNEDGGFSYGQEGYTDSSTSITSHAIVALLGTTWLLDPALLQTEAPAAEAEQQPVIKTASSTNTTTPAPIKKTTTAPEPQVLATTTPAPEDTSTPKNNDKKEEKSTPAAKKNSPNYLLYIVIALALIATIWYLLQPKEKLAKGKK